MSRLDRLFNALCVALFIAIAVAIFCNVMWAITA